MPILVDIPNRQPPEASFFSTSTDDQKRLLETIEQLNITPAKYPRLIDTFCGDQSVANLFEKSGWKSQNILCVDIGTPEAQPKYQLAHWDLVAVKDAILKGALVPDFLSEYKYKFDIMTAYSPYVDEYLNMMPVEELLVLANYFLRSGGLLTHKSATSVKKINLNGWSQVGIFTYQKN